MKFRLGQMYIQSNEGGELVIVCPVGSHMVALKVVLFNMIDYNSISTTIEIYNKEDKSMIKKIESWLGE